MFDSINRPHRSSNIKHVKMIWHFSNEDMFTLHISTDIIKKSTDTRWLGDQIKDLLTSFAPRRPSTHEPRPQSWNTFWVTPKLFLSHLLLSLYGEVIKQTEVQHAHNCSRLRFWMKSTFSTKEIPNQYKRQFIKRPWTLLRLSGWKMTGWHNTSDDDDPRFINDLRRQTFQLCVHIYAAYHRTKNIWYTLKIFCTLNLLGPIPWSWPWPRAWWPPWARLCSGCPRTRFRSLLFREQAQPDIPKRIKTYREAINDGQIDRLFKGILNQYVKGVAGRYDKKDLNLTIARYVNWRMNVCSMFVVMFVIYF